MESEKRKRLFAARFQSWSWFGVKLAIMVPIVFRFTSRGFERDFPDSAARLGSMSNIISAWLPSIARMTFANLFALGIMILVMFAVQKLTMYIAHPGAGDSDGFDHASYKGMAVFFAVGGIIVDGYFFMKGVSESGWEKNQALFTTKSAMFTAAYLLIVGVMSLISTNLIRKCQLEEQS